MTRDRKRKQAVRERQAQTGEPYVVARRATAAQPLVEDEWTPPSVEELLLPGLRHELDRLLDADVASLGDIDITTLPVSEPTVAGFELDASTVYVDPVEEYEGGTLVCNVTATASLSVQGLMAKADAVAAVESGMAEYVDEDFNRHYALVLLREPRMLEVEFDATVTPEIEDVADVNFSGSTALP